MINRVPENMHSTINFPKEQGWTDNSWGPRAIGNHGAPASLPKLKQAYEKGTRGHLMGPPTDPGPRAVPEFPKWSVRPC
ncbi:unnamed protein product [Staurois parvus]|uniref:Uncharacterized protein n=1 Tax=Staurois parvus TaxID=386267 RepID=A0ABN9H836_9NEOB|nr:unnamed protein product [Staurois parvus]